MHIFREISNNLQSTVGLSEQLFFVVSIDNIVVDDAVEVTIGVV